MSPVTRWIGPKYSSRCCSTATATAATAARWWSSTRPGESNDAAAPMPPPFLEDGEDEEAMDPARQPLPAAVPPTAVWSLEAAFFEKPCVRALLLQHSLAPTLTSSGLGKWSSRTNWSVGPVPLQPPGPCASFCQQKIFWENSSILKFFGRHSLLAGIHTRNSRPHKTSRARISPCPPPLSSALPSFSIFPSFLPLSKFPSLFDLLRL